MDDKQQDTRPAYAGIGNLRPEDLDQGETKAMPIYEFDLTRRRIVFDQARITVRADNLEAAEEVDIDELEESGKIHWDCDIYCEHEGIDIENVEDVDDDDHEFGVDVTIGVNATGG
jgi:hypothetical protein